jgi:hypothetical protein
LAIQPADGKERTIAMNTPTTESYVLPRWLRGWEQFWFTPADPSLLALVRITCGMITTYTLFAYSFNLQPFMGEHAWHDLSLRMDHVHERPVVTTALNWNYAGTLPEPKNEFEREYVNQYRRRFGGVKPPPPYPKTEEEAKQYDDFRAQFGVDLRVNGLKLWQNQAQKEYAEAYTPFMGQPPRAYPGQDLDPNDPMLVKKTQEEARQINEYIAHWRVDPRNAYAKGTPVFSLWFHVTDPTAMAALHSVIVACSFLFMIGFCTRLTTAITWFGSLCYIHRNPNVLFGVDTMMTILLFYLMLSPCGVVWSLDRMIRQWWVTAKPRVVAWWYGVLKMPLPDVPPADPVPETPPASVSANIFIRLLQIHVCIVYLYAGLSKLQGQAWWNGGAIWNTMANFEFAPMQFEPYLAFLRFLGSNQLLYDSFMSGGGLFTLCFEIGYAFLIWRPRLRWVFLGSAIVLHGGIGLFMGLKTFSLMMLVMNMAFLRKEEVIWLLSLPGSFLAHKPVPQAAPRPESTAITTSPAASS